MNFRSIVRAAALATAMLTSTTLASDDDYKVTTAGATETKMLTTALANDANYDASENKRICFTAIDKLKQKATDNNTATKYKFYVKGCAVDSAKAGAGQCATGSCATPTPYKVKLIVQTASGAVKVDDIDRDEDGSADSADSDMSDSADSDDATKGTTAKPTVGSAANSTSGAASNPTSSSSSTSTTMTTDNSTATATATASPTTTKNATTPSPTPKSDASATALAATAAVSVAMIMASSL